MPYFVRVPRELEGKFSHYLKKIGENEQYMMKDHWHTLRSLK